MLYTFTHIECGSENAVERTIEVNELTSRRPGEGGERLDHPGSQKLGDSERAKYPQIVSLPH